MTIGQAKNFTIKLKEHKQEPWIKFNHGFNGSPVPLFPGMPDTTEAMQALQIESFRSHDWYGCSDLDAGFSTQYLPQPAVQVPDRDKEAVKQLVADVSNKRTMLLNAPSVIENGDRPDWNLEPTDTMLHKIQSSFSGAEILFRVGRTFGASNKAPSSYQQKDVGYEELAAHVAKEYSVNYKEHGLLKPINHYEIWNEPDLYFEVDGVANNLFYASTPGTYYNMYNKLSRLIKEVDPDVKVGGSSVAFASAVPEYDGYIKPFLQQVPRENIDFFSWHHYPDLDASDPYNFFRLGVTMHKNLREVYGEDIPQSWLTEWNITAGPDSHIHNMTQSPFNGSFICSALIYMQDAFIDQSHYYRADANHLGLFNKDSKYTHAFKAFYGFNTLKNTPYRLETITEQGGFTDIDGNKTDQDTLGFAIIAGTDKPLCSDVARKIKILLSNYVVDPNLFESNSDIKYQQYTVDLGKSANDLDRDLYYGGRDPHELINRNPKDFDDAVYKTRDSMSRQTLEYQNNNGALISIQIPETFNYSKYHARFEWLNSETTLNTPGLEERRDVLDECGEICEHTITISRPELQDYVILGVTIDLS